jgi:iron-sulfur cluster repair protein YtfE (RIC family)
MNPITLLEKQHRKVERLLKQLENKPDNASELLSELANDLAAHMIIEQEIFYPACKEAEMDLVLEAYEEHAIAEIALKRLLATDPEAETFHARVTSLKELIEHHVEEEEKELFPKAEKALEEQRMQELGGEMKARFEEAVEAGYEALLPKRAGSASADRKRKASIRPGAAH